MIKLLKKYNTHLILISVVLSIIFGIYIPDLFSNIKFLGDIFINLLKLFALPLISSALIVTLGGMNKNLHNLKSLIHGTISYMLISEIIAVSIAIALFNIFDAGRGVDPNLVLQGSKDPGINTSSLNIANFLLSIFPQNIFESLAKFELLPVVIFSCLFGVGCNIIGDSAKPIVQGCAAIRDVSASCLNGVMLLSPLGIFALIGSGIATSGATGHLEGSFRALISFVSILTAGLFIHALWQLILIIVLSKQKLSKILKNSIPVFSTAFATSSSIATLPNAMQAADNLGSDHTVTRFMLPLCAPINIGGMMMYEVAAALFFSQVLGIDLPLSQQILLALAGILSGMAAGGIPESSLVSLIVVFKIVNIPINAISILLPLDRIIDRLRTMVNIFGNMCGSIVVSRIIKKNSTIT